MPLFMSKKKGLDLEDPDSLEFPPPKAGPPKAKAAAAPMPEYRPRAAMTETVEETAEGGGDFGQKLAADIDAAAPEGMATEEWRGHAANLFSAVANCLAQASGGGYEAESETEEA